MTNCNSAAETVADFLRRALADGVSRVPELEAKARAAGLLRPNQHITHAKLFKRAKKSLGIRSLRSGFGVCGEWTWRLDGASAKTNKAGGDQQIAGSELPGRRIALDWADGVAALDDGPPPERGPSPSVAAFLGGLPRLLELTCKPGGTCRLTWLECARSIRLPPQSASRSPWQRRPALDYRRRRACRAALRLRCHRGCEGPIAAHLPASPIECELRGIALDRSSPRLTRRLRSTNHLSSLTAP